MDALTYSIKLQVFSKDGHQTWDAQFPAPPVCTAPWNTNDFVKWVDQKGNWFKKKG